MAFALPDLPFAKDALGPHMSAETLDFHHGKHHGTYVTKVNELIGDTDLEGASLVEVIRAARERNDKNLFNNGKLEVTSLHDADTPVAHGMTPLLTIDVWEHAYYIDYRNERPRYVKSVLENIINWDFVAQNLDGQGTSRADQQARISADSLS